MTKSRKLTPKSRRFKLGTDEAFFKLMEVSGSKYRSTNFQVFSGRQMNSEGFPKLC